MKYFTEIWRIRTSYACKYEVKESIPKTSRPEEKRNESLAYCIVWRPGQETTSGVEVRLRKWNECLGHDVGMLWTNSGQVADSYQGKLRQSLCLLIFKAMQTTFVDANARQIQMPFCRPSFPSITFVRTTASPMKILNRIKGHCALLVARICFFCERQDKSKDLLLFVTNWRYVQSFDSYWVDQQWKTFFFLHSLFA